MKLAESDAKPGAKFAVAQAAARSSLWALGYTTVFFSLIFVPIVGAIPCVAGVCLWALSVMLLGPYGGDTAAHIVAFLLAVVLLALFRLAHLIYLHLHSTDIVTEFELERRLPRRMMLIEGSNGGNPLN